MTVRIGLADADDPRVREAARRIANAGAAIPVLVSTAPIDLDPGVELERVPSDAPGGEIDHLARFVATGRVAAGVSGSITPSSEVLRAGIRHLRSRATSLISGCFAIRHDTRWATYADCVVVPMPDAGQLADIAASAADHHQRMFGEEPRIAMLSFSTAGSASHPRVTLVQEATRLLRERRPDLAVEGEVQFDVAVDDAVAARKAPGSRVAGAANVLVFPSLEAGNIAYKVAERVGGSQALGSFVLGLDRPWVDLSRGCSTDCIVATVELLSRAIDVARTTDSIAG